MRAGSRRSFLPRQPSFWILWWGQAVSQAGTGVFTVALMWVAARGGPARAAWAGVALVLPALLGTVGGTVVDATDRLALLVGTDLGRGVVSLAAGALVAAGLLPFPALWSTAFLLSAGQSLFTPAEMALVPQLVDEASLPAANGLNLAGTQAAGVVGYFLGGGVTAAGGPALALALDAASFFASAFSLWAVRRQRRLPPATPTPAPVPRAPLAASWRRGLALLLRDPVLRWLLPTGVAAELCWAPMVSGLAILARGMHLGAGGYALLEVAWAGGMLLGGAAASWATRTLGLGGIFGPVLASGGAALWVSGAWATSPWTQLGLVWGGAVSGLATAAAVTWVQRRTPPQVQGRVFGSVVAVLTAAMPVGLALYGLVAARLPAGSALLVSGTGLGAAGILASLPTPWRRMLGQEESRARSGGQGVSFGS